MNKTEDIFNKAKNEVQKLWDNQNELSDFVKFPAVSYTHLTLPTKA